MVSFPKAQNWETRRRVYSSLIEPFLDMERQNLANQAMGCPEPDVRDPTMPRCTWRSADCLRSRRTGRMRRRSSSRREQRRSREAPGSLRLKKCGACSRRKLGDADGAIEHYKASVAVEPERELPLKRLAELYGMRKDFINGASWMERYVATKPLGLGHQYGTLGDYYLAAKDVSNAVKALQKGLEVDAYTFWVRYRLAQLFEEQKDNKQAALQYETALRYGYDRDPEIYSRLAKLYKADGRTADAVKLVKTGMRIFPDKFRAVPSIR